MKKIIAVLAILGVIALNPGVSKAGHCNDDWAWFAGGAVAGLVTGAILTDAAYSHGPYYDYGPSYSYGYSYGSPSYYRPHYYGSSYSYNYGYYPRYYNRPYCRPYGYRYPAHGHYYEESYY